MIQMGSPSDDRGLSYLNLDLNDEEALGEEAYIMRGSSCTYLRCHPLTASSEGELLHQRVTCVIRG